ncbi:hypothetical protein [Escherichia phage vB_Eco_ZCEC08]
MSCAPIFPVTTSLAHDVINNLTAPDGCQFYFENGYSTSILIGRRDGCYAYDIERGFQMTMTSLQKALKIEADRVGAVLTVKQGIIPGKFLRVWRVY